MQAQSMNHPAPEVLRALVAGQLDGAAADAAFAHLERCTACRESAAALSGDSFLRRLRAARPTGSTMSEARGDTQGSKGGSPTQTYVPPAVLPELRDHPQYEVVRELGRGGMGVVYLARNKLLDRPEVLKVVGKHLLDRPGAAERFQREIRSAAKLSHPNIVTAHAAFQVGDLLVFAMEFVEGETLTQVVQGRGRLPVANACYYAQQVAQGLQHACDRGMVHRDIKPQNLILARQGKKHTVKILDFGLAKATQEGGQDEGGLTGTGAMLGTPDYIAPEQTLDAAKADIRADIYSLGCTLYFLLSGAPPFQGKSTFEILQAHLSKAPAPLDRVRADVPAALAAVVAKMMAKDPARRYQQPAEVVQALAPFVQGGLKLPPTSPTLLEGGAPAKPANTMVERGTTLAEPRRPSRKRTLVLGAAGLLGLGAVALLGVLALGGGVLYLLNQGTKAESGGGSGQGAGKEEGPKKDGAADQNAGGGDRPIATGKVPASLRTTVGFVDYEVAGSWMNGRVWEFTVKATNRQPGNRRIFFRTLDVRTDQGETYSPAGRLMPDIRRLAEGESVLIKMTMSTLPPDLRKLARVELRGDGSGSNGPPEPVVFLDVPVNSEPDVVVKEQPAAPPQKGDPSTGKPAPTGQDGNVASSTPKKVPANLRTTANGIDYEVARSRMDGRVWELTLKATARPDRGSGSILLWTLQVTTEDGKKFQLPPGKVMPQTALDPGIPENIKITMSTLPPGVKKLSQVRLTVHQSAFGRGAEPVVFLDVPIEPDPEVGTSPTGETGATPGGSKASGKRAPANLRTTANGVDYEVARSRMDGRVWELTLKVTRRPSRGSGSLLLWGMQVTTEDGQKLKLPAGKVMRQTALDVGKPEKIKITMSTLPPGVKKLRQVVLVEHGSAFSAGAEPVVFLDVPIEPDPEAAGSPPGNAKK